MLGISVQWLIDIVFEMVMARMKGFIIAWSGAIVDIPDGWALCDGNNGTPDLRNNFIVGAGDDHAVNDSAGSPQHHHSFTGDGHWHSTPRNKYVDEGTEFTVCDIWKTTTNPATGNTDVSDNLPPYWALAWIMKL